MSESSNRPRPGSIGWIDLTVEDAASVRDFYAAVTGWQSQEFDMGGYSDFVMSPPEREGLCGICHARQGNAQLPAAWLIYIVVEDLEQAMAEAVERGGSVLKEASAQGDNGRYAVLSDPAGAAFALYQFA